LWALTFNFCCRCCFMHITFPHMFPYFYLFSSPYQVLYPSNSPFASPSPFRSCLLVSPLSPPFPYYWLFLRFLLRGAMEGTIANLHPISTKNYLHQTKLVNGNARINFNARSYLLFLGFFLRWAMEEIASLQPIYINQRKFTSN
jgi:hypothetical protein